MGQGNRAWAHQEWWAKGREPEIVLRTDHKSEAIICEMALIRKFGRISKRTGTLLNRTDGNVPMKGKERITDRRTHRKRRSAWQKAEAIL